jgi:hypothetical protein
VRQRAGHRDLPHHEQIAHGEMQPDAEHEEDDADLRELRCEPDVGHEPGREGADRHARQQVADEGWESQTRGEEAEHEGESEAGGDRRNESRLA